MPDDGEIAQNRVPPLRQVIGDDAAEDGAGESCSPTRATDGITGLTQSIAMGPVASQEAIKMLGTNGGGFFNVNSARPSRRSRATSQRTSRWTRRLTAHRTIPAG